MATIVLLPGAWLDATAWDDVTGPLTALGHDVHAVTLTGLGERAAEGGSDTDLATHVRDVVSRLDAQALDEVVLVGHSYASLVAFGVLHDVPDRIVRLVSIAGDPPTPGASLLDAMPPDARDQIRRAAANSPEGWRMPMLSDEELDLFYGDHGLDRTDQRRRLHELATGHPIGTWEQGLPLDHPDAGQVPVTHVRCLGDPQEYAPPLPETWERRDVDSGHWPMLTAPAALAALLDEVARRSPGDRPGPPE